MQQFGVRLTDLIATIAVVLKVNHHHFEWVEGPTLMRFFAAAVAATFALSVPASSATVTIDLFGKVDTWFGYSSANVAANDQIRFSITYDDTKVNSSGNPIGGSADNPGHISAVATFLKTGSTEAFYGGDYIGGVTYPFPSFITTYRDWDVLDFYGMPDGTFNNYSVIAPILGASEFTAAVAGGPPTTWLFEQYYYPSYGTPSPTTSFGTCADYCEVSGTITSVSVRSPNVSAVPIPASLPLLFAGLAGVAAIARKRRV